MDQNSYPILVDARWIGSHGIGRFAHEIITRLPEVKPLPPGIAPYPFLFVLKQIRSPQSFFLLKQG